MSPDFIHSVFGHAWSILLVILFFGGSIFVHELGHFLAARRRGVHVERFSICFGSAIWSWRGKDGVEYRVGWIPLGGYVLLPQLADLGPIEGKSEAEAVRLPPVDYVSKLIVFVSGAVFNVLFAFVLACVLWLAGIPESKEIATTRIGYVTPTIDLPDGTTAASPAFQAGLRTGDVIEEIDGSKVSDWVGVRNALTLGSGRDAAGRPKTILKINRDGRSMDVTVLPILAGDDKVRKVGFLPAMDLLVHEVAAGSPAALAGFLAGDQVLSLDGVSMQNLSAFGDYIDANRAKAIGVRVRRGGADTVLAIGARPNEKPGSDFGLLFDPGITLVHTSPYALVRDQLSLAFQTLATLLNPRSDVGLSKLSGPIGIVHMLSSAADVDIREVLLFTVMINVSLAVFNLLPVPVLDGGHMVFATVARLRGRALPANFVMTTQSVFFALILFMFVYVSISDVRRWARDVQEDHAAEAAGK
ncbi:MAG: RIP metalloprotease RseP [Opitutaceae bacterium]